ncbi:MAG: antitoxin [Acidobacteria bacterium]|nr:antitoxin [Acidobacteriota bacterium]
MRTTLSLDDDVANLLHRKMRRSGASFKETVNHFLRQGLLASDRENRKPFTVAPRPLGLLPGMSYDKVEDLIEALEGATHK